jgi:hypothetical protein
MADDLVLLLDAQGFVLARPRTLEETASQTREHSARWAEVIRAPASASDASGPVRRPLRAESGQNGGPFDTNNLTFARITTKLIPRLARRPQSLCRLLASSPIQSRTAAQDQPISPQARLIAPKPSE